MRLPSFAEALLESARHHRHLAWQPAHSRGRRRGTKGDQGSESHGIHGAGHFMRGLSRNAGTSGAQDGSTPPIKRLGFRRFWNEEPPAGGSHAYKLSIERDGSNDRHTVFPQARDFVIRLRDFSCSRGPIGKVYELKTFDALASRLLSRPENEIHGRRQRSLTCSGDLMTTLIAHPRGGSLRPPGRSTRSEGIPLWAPGCTGSP